MRFLSSIRIVRVSLALAVALWMAGAGCMLGCENMMTVAASNDVASSPASSPAIVVSGEVCASKRSHDCCAKGGAHSASKAAKAISRKLQFVPDAHRKISTPAKDNLKLVEQWPAGTTPSLLPALGATFPTMVDCPLAVNATAALSKAGPDDSNVALPSPSERSSLSNLPEQVSSFAQPLRLPNRGHTYLRCCVFLI